MFQRRAYGRLSVGVMLAVATLVATTTVAAAARDTASANGVTAVFTYRGGYPISRDPHLLIKVSGATRYDAAVSSKWCGHQCWPNQVAPGQRVLRVVRLDSHGPRDVVLSLYSGGAHCCTVEQVFSPTSTTGSYRMSEYDFGDPAVRVEPIGPQRSDVFVSANDAFAYAFTDYAASGMPVEIVSFTGGAFHNVTRRYPQRIASDAALWLSTFNAAATTHYQDTVGLVAAWAADEELLGHHASVRTFLNRQAAAGHLNSALTGVEPSGARFVTALLRFLNRHGYPTS